MNGILLRLLAGAALSSVAMFASQTSVEVAYDGTTSTQSSPLNAYAPYNATLYTSSGVFTRNLEVVCDDDYSGDGALGSATDYWETSASDLLLTPPLSGDTSGSLRWWSTLGSSIQTNVYEEGSYLAYMELTVGNSNTSEENALQYAIWDLFLQGSFGSSPLTTVPTGTGVDSYVYWLCEAGVKAFTGFAPTTACGTGGIPADSQGGLSTSEKGDLSQVIILTPKSGGPGTGDQEFFALVSGSTPEPASYALMGLGLVLLSLGTFRRVKKPN